MKLTRRTQRFPAIEYRNENVRDVIILFDSHVERFGTLCNLTNATKSRNIFVATEFKANNNKIHRVRRL